MKKIILFLLLTLPAIVFAQKKVDLDKFTFTAQYRGLPKLAIDSTYRTYDVHVVGSSMMQPVITEMNAEKTVELEGWRKLNSRGHITINIKVDDLLPEAVTVKERVTQTKDKAGNITGTKIFYYQEVVYTFAAHAEITDYRGAHLKDEVLDTRSYKKTYKGPEFTNRQMASGYFLINSLKLTRELYRKNLNNALHYLSDRISDDYGYRVVNVTDHMWIVDSRSHPEYEAHRKAFLSVTDAIFKMDASTPLDSLSAELKPAIRYFESIKKRYSSSSKHDRKIRYASYFNLAVIYYYLDDPQRMMKEAKGLMLNDFDAKDGRAFEQTANWLKNVFEQANRNTRHFPIDINTFEGPYDQRMVADKAVL